jgi:flagellar hook assembly protein FlgD
VMQGFSRLYPFLIVAATLAVLAAVAQVTPVPPALAQAPNVCGPNPSPPDPSDPAIRVWDPVPGEHATSPLTVRGRARVFEANVQLLLRDAAGRDIIRGFTTAAEAGPALAPFEGSLAFTVSRETPACLWVFEESARDGSPRNVVQIPLTLLPAGARYSESALDLGELRPCIPVPGDASCDFTRLALWNGDAQAWAARGVTNADARFNETVVFRVRAGDPAAIRNIARILGWPYLQITRLKFAGTAPEFVEITNLGGGAQDAGGWTVRSPQRNVTTPLPAGLVLGAGQSCRVYTGSIQGDSCGGAMLVGPDVWPDAGGRTVLYADPIDLPAADTRYDAGAASQPPPPNLQGVVVAGDVPVAEAFELVLRTPQTAYAAGETVPFEMVLRNRSGQTQTLTFLGGQDFDIVVRDAAGAEVWRWSTGRVFTQQIRMESFAPGEERRFSATWDQRSDAGQRVAPGNYQATATTATRSVITSNTVSFRIEPSPTSAFEFTLSTPRSAYPAGEEIPFEMVLRNTSSRQQTLTFRSGQDFELVVRNENGDEVWRWSTGRVFTQQIREVTFAPGEARRFSATWDQRSNAGQPVPPGAYRAVATTNTVEPVESNAVVFRIERPPAEQVEFTLSTPRQVYAVGQEVPFEMRLRNRGDRPVTLTFPTGQDFDIVVRNAAGMTVWRWSEGRAFTQALRDVTLAPGEERRFSATWDQQTSDGRQVDPGTYQATATLTVSEPVQSNTVGFRIEE